MHESLVEKLSVRKCITVNENDNLKLAINLLATHKIGALPVINSKKRIVGIVSERDIINFFSSQNNKEILSKKINSIMTKLYNIKIFRGVSGAFLGYLMNCFGLLFFFV